jgi:hypothetical protein
MEREQARRSGARIGLPGMAGVMIPSVGVVALGMKRRGGLDV